MLAAMSRGTRLTISMLLVGAALLFSFNLMRSGASAEAIRDNSPWKTPETMKAFMYHFGNTLSQTNDFTREEIKDIYSIEDTLTMLDEMPLLGMSNKRTLEALNVAFGSAIAEIAVSESGVASLGVKSNAIIDALTQAFLQTTGEVNFAFINEIKQLINMFATNSDRAIATNSDSTSSLSFPGVFRSGNINSGESVTNLNSAVSTAPNSNGWENEPQMFSSNAAIANPFGTSNVAEIFEKAGSTNGVDNVADLSNESPADAGAKSGEYVATNATPATDESGLSYQSTDMSFKNLGIQRSYMYDITKSFVNVLLQLYSPSSISRVSNTISDLKSGEFNFILILEKVFNQYKAISASGSSLSAMEETIQVILELTNAIVTVLRTSRIGRVMDLVVAYILYIIVPVSSYKGLNSNDARGILKILSLDETS